MPLTPQQISDEFPLDPEVIYLNHAAVAPWPRRAAEAITRFAEENVRFGARDYPHWLVTERRLRQRIARLINAPKPGDVALVKNTSEGLSFVAYGLEWRAGDNVVIGNQEFPSNRVVWESLRARFGVEVREAELCGEVTPEQALIDRFDANTRLLSVSSVQYATGMRLDLELLGRACRDAGVLFCVDGIQSLGALEFDLARIHADFVVADGHKWMLGPEGLALFYCNPELRERLRLHEFGWHNLERHDDFDRRDWTLAPDARRFECGSPNLLGAVALESSLALLEEAGMSRIEEMVLDNVRFLGHGLESISGIELVTSLAPGRHGGILTFRHRELGADLLFERLWKSGVVCARRGGGVRFSPHFYTPKARLEAALAAVERAVTAPGI